MDKENKIIGRECKHVFHLPAIENFREDTHVIKEVIHYKNGDLKNKLRVISNYKRPYYITKQPYQNHSEKKEAEELIRVNKYADTQSNLHRGIASRLGSRYTYAKSLRDVRDSPYVYGIDINSKTYIKQAYLEKWPEAVSKSKLATFDIETDTIKDEVIVVSISMEDKIFTAINKNLLLHKLTNEKDCSKLEKEFNGKLEYLFDKHIPRVYTISVNGFYVDDIKKGILTNLHNNDNELIGTAVGSEYYKDTQITKIEIVVIGDRIPKCEYVIELKKDIIEVESTGVTNNIKKEYKFYDNEFETIKGTLAIAHKWEPDFIAIWNISYDIPKILEVFERYGEDPAKYFADPSLPDNLKYFRWKEGQTSKKTESGKHKPVNVEEQWHVVDCPASFYWIDAMSSHRYIRVGGKTMAGGYSLNNILGSELGNKLGKLKFEDEKTNNLTGLEWHHYMVAEKPLEYIIYNQWDNMSMLHLDDKTKDLQQVLPMLSGVSGYDIFNSGPKRIVDAMHFFYLENEKLLGSKGNKVDETKLLGLGDWIKNK